MGEFFDQARQDAAKRQQLAQEKKRIAEKKNLEVVTPENVLSFIQEFVGPAFQPLFEDLKRLGLKIEPIGPWEEKIGKKGNETTQRNARRYSLALDDTESFGSDYPTYSQILVQPVFWASFHVPTFPLLPEELQKQVRKHRPAVGSEEISTHLPLGTLIVRSLQNEHTHFAGIEIQFGRTVMQFDFNKNTPEAQKQIMLNNARTTIYQLLLEESASRVEVAIEDAELKMKRKRDRLEAERKRRDQPKAQKKK